MQQLRNMGSMKKMLGMLPGMGQMREALDNFDEREVNRIEAIIQSMTPAERDNPKIINGSRRSRIAKGSGTTVTEINQLLQRFDAAQKMMRQMNKGGGAGMPGMPGMGKMPGVGKRAGARQAKKDKKMTPQQRAAAARKAARDAQTPTQSSGSSFGLGNQEQVDPSSLELPPGLDKFLGR
jgi:signal recognition particle subunit SRP54